MWFKVDDKLHDHRKTRRLRRDKAAAIGLWTLCGSWASDNTTDGFVPAEVAERWDPDGRLAERLVEVGLWHRAEADGEDGYRFHEWAADGDGTPRNPSAAEVRSYRASRSSAGSLGNHRRWHVDRGVVDAGCRFCQEEGSSRTDRTSDRTSDRGSESGANPPTRPDPTRDTPSPDGDGGPASSQERSQQRSGSRGTRIPDGFEVTPAMVAWARENTPLVGRSETDDFVDYWRAASGRNAVKRDWTAAWRHWMRKAQRDAEARSRRGGGRSRPSTDDRIRAFLTDDDEDTTSYGATGTDGPGLYALPGGDEA